MIGCLAERLGFSEAECGRIALALDEALCNVINHGYDRRQDGTIWLRVWVQEEGVPEITLVVDDRARQVDLSTIRSRDLEEIRPGGLGVHIIQQVMDDVRYEHRAGGGMRLTMIKRHAGDRADDMEAASGPPSSTEHDDGGTPRTEGNHG